MSDQQTIYGIKCDLEPSFPFAEVREDLLVDGIDLIINGPTIEARFRDKQDETKAKRIIEELVRDWSFRQRVKITPKFNLSYTENAPDAKHINLKLGDQVKLLPAITVGKMRVAQATQTGTARIVKAELYNSSSFKNDAELLTRASINPAISKAINYYYDALDSDNPWAHLYMALEELINFAGDTKKLAAATGKTEEWVKQTKETANSYRHAITQSRKHIGVDECFARVKELIIIISSMGGKSQ